ncbi:MAG: hypothetical protein WCK15_11635 [Pirellula sp.]
MIASLVIVVVIVVTIGILAVRTSLIAEENLQAYLHAHRAAIEYMELNKGEWPQSWDNLRSVRPESDFDRVAKNASLSTAIETARPLGSWPFAKDLRGCHFDCAERRIHARQRLRFMTQDEPSCVTRGSFDSAWSSVGRPMLGQPSAALVIARSDRRLRAPATFP